jgi:hypothetical protein
MTPWLELEPGRKLTLPSGLIIRYHNLMSTPRKNGIKKRPGRPATGQGIQIGTRWSESTVDAVDAWAARQSDKPGRSEAIRRLVELGLKGKGK